MECWIHDKENLQHWIFYFHILIKPLKTIHFTDFINMWMDPHLFIVLPAYSRHHIVNYILECSFLSITAVHPMLQWDREQMRLFRRCLWCPPAVRDNNQMWRGEFDTCKSAHCGQLPGWSILLAGTEPERDSVSQSGFLIKCIQSFESELYVALVYCSA